MIVYDYFDRDGKIIATFTDDHETERKHLASAILMPKNLILKNMEAIVLLIALFLMCIDCCLENPNIDNFM